MGIKINSFGGVLVWILRKRYSNVTSKIMLSITAKRYNKVINQYITWFQKQSTVPLFSNVMIETLNRCNGKCSFCPANIRDEKREYAKMELEMYQNIIRELHSINWKGRLFLNVNNEPFVDVRIVKLAGIAKKELSGVEIVMISNGTLLNPQKVKELEGVVDELILNDYGYRYKLSDNIKEIYKAVKKNPKEYKDINIVINRRYSEEILATRAGSAPNKPYKNNKINESCIYPYTDLIIFPTGKVGLCCNDCYEVTEYGQVGEQTLIEIWQSDKFTHMRKAMMKGRSEWDFCQECDVVDAGGREAYIKKHKIFY